MAKKACSYPNHWQPICIFQPSTLVSLLNAHTQNTAICSRIMIVCAYSVYIHALLYHYRMWTHRLQPPTLVSILHVHTQIAAINSRSITVCACSDYRHIPFYHYCMCILELQPSTHVPLLYVHTQITAIQSCIITLFAQTTGTYPFIITVCAPIDYIIHSCIITVCATSDYSHSPLYQYCMCILELHPSTHVPLLYSQRLQAHTLLSLLYVHP